MITHETVINIRHNESDQRGCVLYTCFPCYMEEARIELMKKLKFDCKKFADAGGSLLLTSMQVNFFRAIYDGDVIKIKISLMDNIENQLRFVYKFYNQKKKLVAKANNSFYLTKIATKSEAFDLSKFFDNIKDKLENVETF